MNSFELGVLASYLLTNDPTKQTLSEMAKITNLSQTKCKAYLQYKGYKVSDGKITMSANTRKEIEEARFVATAKPEEVVKKMTEKPFHKMTVADRITELLNDEPKTLFRIMQLIPGLEDGIPDEKDDVLIHQLHQAKFVVVKEGIKK